MGRRAAGARVYGAAVDRSGPLPGEEACFECPLPDCIEADPACPRRVRYAAFCRELRARIDRALEGDGTFVMELGNSGWRSSVGMAVSRMLPTGVTFSSEMGRRGATFVLQVTLRRQPARA